MEEQKPSAFQKLKSYLHKCRIVLRVTKKPTKDEFYTIVKVSALGMVIIGLIGFVIQLAVHFLL